VEKAVKQKHERHRDTLSQLRKPSRQLFQTIVCSKVEEVRTTTQKRTHKTRHHSQNWQLLVRTAIGKAVAAAQVKWARYPCGFSSV